MFSAIRKTSAWPLALQFALTISLILVAFVLEFPLEEKGLGTPFTLFLTCVCLVTVLFGRRAGFLAVALSAPLSALFFRPVGSFQLTRAFDLIQIEFYVALAVGAVLVLDQVRCALAQASERNEKLEEESTQKTLQLREAAHRMANNFASLDALIRQRAMASKDPKIQFAFEQASNLVHIVARLNSRLSAAANDSDVDSGIFIPEICKDLQACAQDGVTIECDAEGHDLPLTIAVPLGLIINELVTNALKYAFPNKREGTVIVTFLRARPLSPRRRGQRGRHEQGRARQRAWPAPARWVLQGHSRQHRYLLHTAGDHGRGEVRGALRARARASRELGDDPLGRAARPDAVIGTGPNEFERGKPFGTMRPACALLCLRLFRGADHSGR